MAEKRRVFTCGVKWGDYALPFTPICLEHNLAILGSYNNGIGTFRNAKEGDLIVLKDGFYIIAIGEFEKRWDTNLLWSDVLERINIRDKDIYDSYWFTPNDEIDVIKVKSWVQLLGKSIYYPARQASIQIRNDKILRKCNKFFEANNIENFDYNDAINEFTKAIELDNNNNSKAYINRGDFYYTYRKYDDAIDDYTKAIELDNNNSKAYIHRGSGYCAKKEYDLAISDYTKSIELNPISETYRLKGSAYYSDGKYDNAIANLDKAIELDPNNSKAYMSRANTYNNKKEYDLAISDYTKSIELEPIREAYNFRGFLYFLKEEYDLFINDYTESIKLDENDSLAYIIRGSGYCAKKEYDLAISDADKSIELNDNNSLAYMLKAISYNIKKEYKEAIDNYRISFDLEIENGIDGEIADFIFKYINIIDEDKYSLQSIIDKLVDREYLWKNKYVYINNKIKKLSIYEYILLYFITFKEKDDVSKVAYYTNTVVLEKLIEDKSSMRMSTLSKVNDPEEGKVLIKILSDYRNKNPKERDKQAIKEEDNEERDVDKDYVVQTSFSRCIDSLTMFRLYGKNEDKEGTGVSLVFGKEFFDTTFQYNEVPFSSTIKGDSVSNNIQNNQNKQPLYYVLYYDEKTNEIVFNPY